MIIKTSIIKQKLKDPNPFLFFNNEPVPYSITMVTHANDALEEYLCMQR